MAYNKYHEGKIYRLLSPSRPDIDPYYGSTIMTLQKRLIKHKFDAKTLKYTSKQIIDIGDAIIELVENYPCENKYDLELRERWWIEKNPHVNKCIPTRTQQEWIDANKSKVKIQRIEYRKNKADVINRWFYENRESLRIKYREYEEKNKERRKEERKDYRMKNKDIINEKKRRIFLCVCDRTYRHGHKARHERTQYHINYINNPFANLNI